MAQVIQFPSKMVFGFYGLSYDDLKKGCDARVYSQTPTMRYSRIIDSPGLRAMLEGAFVIPKMTAEGLEFLMNDRELSKPSAISFAQAFSTAVETGKPHLLVFKIGSHHVPEIAYDRDCTRGQEIVIPYTVVSSDEYYLKPAKVRVFRIYRLNAMIKSKYPSFTLENATTDFA